MRNNGILATTHPPFRFSKQINCDGQRQSFSANEAGEDVAEFGSPEERGRPDRISEEDRFGKGRLACTVEAAEPRASLPEGSVEGTG